MAFCEPYRETILDLGGYLGDAQSHVLGFEALYGNVEPTNIHSTAILLWKRGVAHLFLNLAQFVYFISDLCRLGNFTQLFLVLHGIWVINVTCSFPCAIEFLSFVLCQCYILLETKWEIRLDIP